MESLIHWSIVFLAAVLIQGKFNLSVPRQRWSKLAQDTHSNTKSTLNQVRYISWLWKNKSLLWWKYFCSFLETFVSIIPNFHSTKQSVIMYNGNGIFTADCATHCCSYSKSNLVYLQFVKACSLASVTVCALLVACVLLLCLIVILCHYLNSGLYSRGHLPTSQRGRYLCQICPQVALWCPQQELHTLLVWRLRWKPESLWHAWAVCERLWKTRYMSCS